jgi:hypothetical protein
MPFSRRASPPRDEGSPHLPPDPVLAPGEEAENERGFRSFYRALGPGIIVGAADDDPSGIATYSVAGAQLGPAMLWTALLTWPLMAAVQTMCARIGMVTGQGLASALHAKFPRWLLATAAAALMIANTLNLGADLTAMADAAELLPAGAHAQVAGAGAVRIRHRRLLPSPRLERCGARDVRSVHPARQTGVADARGDPRNDDLAVPFLLAGVAGGGRREGQGAPQAG